MAIGELENRLRPVPVTFSSENLDIRHRLPDHRVKDNDALLVSITPPQYGVSTPQGRTLRPRYLFQASTSPCQQLSRFIGAVPRQSPEIELLQGVVQLLERVALLEIVLLRHALPSMSDERLDDLFLNIRLHQPRDDGVP